MNFYTLITMITITLTGCGTSIGFLRDSTTSQNFSYAMSVKTLHMKRTVSASTEAKTLVCLIPTAGDPPYATAMEKLHAEAKLGPNEVLANIREDKRILVYIIYCKHRLTISADVYKLGGDLPPRDSSTEEGSSKLKKPAWDKLSPSEPASKPKPDPEPPPNPCEDKYWKCMKYCGTRGCGGKCVKEKTKCNRKRRGE